MINFMGKKWLRTEYCAFDPVIVVAKKFYSRDLAVLRNSQEFCGRERFTVLVTVTPTRR